MQCEPTSMKGGSEKGENARSLGDGQPGAWLPSFYAHSAIPGHCPVCPGDRGTALPGQRGRESHLPRVRAVRLFPSCEHGRRDQAAWTVPGSRPALAAPGRCCSPSALSFPPHRTHPVSGLRACGWRVRRKVRRAKSIHDNLKVAIITST